MASLTGHRRRGRIADTTLVLSLTLFFICCFSNSCGEEKDLVTPSIVISGKVTNSSGATGDVVVEIDYNKRDLADSEGRYQIAVTRDFLVDSLYAWIDGDGNKQYNQGERFGFFHSQSDSIHAHPFQVRGQNVPNVDFTIP